MHLTFVDAIAHPLKPNNAYSIKCNQNKLIQNRCLFNSREKYFERCFSLVRIRLLVAHFKKRSFLQIGSVGL